MTPLFVSLALAGTARGQAPPSSAPKASAATGKTATAARDPFALTAEQFTLPSGMTVLLRRDSAVPRVAVTLNFSVGSKDEAPGRTGFAHLYEHLMFMGTKNVPDNKFDLIMESEGGGNNATTDNDRTFYYDLGPSHLLETLLWLEAERLVYLPEVMTDKKVDLQRDVVRNERRQSYENRPYGIAELRLPELLYPKGHPYSWPVIGSHQDLLAASTQDVKQFFYTYYTPANATLAVVGDFDPKAAKALVQKYFGWMPKSQKPKAVTLASGIPLVSAPVQTRLTVTDKVALPKVYLAWHAPPVQSPDYVQAALLADVLAKGKASRLHRALVVEQKLAQSIEVDVEPLTLGSVLVVAVTAQQGVTGEALMAALEKEVGRLTAQPITDAEVERARSQRLTELARQIETPLGQAQWLQMMHQWLGDALALPKLVQQLRAVTAADTMARAKAMGLTDPQRRLAMSILPQPKTAAAPAAKPAEPEKKVAAVAVANAAAEVPAPSLGTPPFDFAKTPKLGAVKTLVPPKSARFSPGGIDVLLVQRRGSALLELTAMVPVGEKDSPADKGGLAQAVATMLTEGAGSRSATEVATALESLGASVRTTVGQDMTQLSLSVLSDRYAQAAPILGDVLQRPRLSATDWQRVRGERVATLSRMRDEPRYNAERALLSSLYGAAHPYSRPPLGTDASLARIQAEDLAQFHKSHYLEGQAGPVTLVIAGDLELTAAQAQQLVAPLALTAVAKPASAPVSRPALPAPTTQRGLVLVDRPGAPQTEMRVANLIPSRLDPDRGVADVAQVLLGGMFTSRLNQNLREQHGYTYGSQALLTRLAESGYFIAQAALRSDVTVEGLTETLHELQRITQQQMTVAEAQKGQKAALQHLVAQGERAAGLSQLYATLVRYGLPLDELSRLGRSVLLATPAQLLRVAKSEIRPSEATIVLVGDVKKLEPLLRKLPGLQAAPQYRDLDGNTQ